MLQPPKVTTGPLAGSRKIYSAPQGHDDVRVPLREIALTDGSLFPVYDTSGPYTDADATHRRASAGCRLCAQAGSQRGGEIR